MNRYKYLVLFMLAVACDVSVMAANVPISLNTNPSDSVFVYLENVMFGRKNNRHLFKDVQCRFEEGCLIIATVSAIGKWLAPSFVLSDEQAKVYAGRELQSSNMTRRSFASNVEYVVTREGWQVMIIICLKWPVTGVIYLIV